MPIIGPIIAAAAGALAPIAGSVISSLVKPKEAPAPAPDTTQVRTAMQGLAESAGNRLKSEGRIAKARA